MAKRTRIVEGTWDCTSCGTRGVLGRHKSCPSCGNPRDVAAESRFDFGSSAATGASSRPTVTDAVLLAQAGAGADWSCAFCEAANPGDALVCRTCGAAREERPRPPAPAGKPASAGTPTSPSAKSRRWLAFGSLGCLGVAGLLGVLVAVGVWGGRTHEYGGRVVERTWKREIVRERFTAVVKEGWQDQLSARSAVMPVRGRGEVAGVERIRDCVTRQRSTRRVEDGTQEVCEDRTRSVSCGTEERCQTRDLGNGFAEEVCEDVTKYCDESYRDCHQETRYRDEPVFGVSCRYDTWEWRAAAPRVEQGRDDVPRWPAVSLDALDRERRSESYAAVVEYQAGRSVRHHTLPLRGTEEYERWVPGQAVSVTVSNFGDVKGVRSLDGRPPSERAPAGPATPTRY